MVSAVSLHFKGAHRVYSLIIADDESRIRRGLSHSINWNELGFSLAASFEDGIEVLEYIKTNPVDAILSDIVMCNIGGLEIAKYIYEKRLPTKVMLMSGYQDFKFAHDAIRFHVFDYLLKPVANKELTEKFRLLKETLDLNNGVSVTTQDEENAEITDCIFDMQTVMIKRMWSGQYPDSRIVGLISSAMGLKLSPEESAVVFMCQCTDGNGEVRELIKRRRNELSENGCLACAIDEEHILCMLFNVRQVDENKRIRGVMTLLSDEEHGFLFVKKKRILLKTVDTELKIAETVKLISDSVLFLQSLDKFETSHSCSLKFPDSTDGDLKVPILKLIIDVFGTRIYPVKISEEIIQLLFEGFKPEGDMNFLLKSLYEKMLAVQNGPFDGNCDFAIEKVRQYIKSHLREDISVGALAETVHLNSAYFGRYFKKATFMTVKQYIYENRMELAIELLAQKKYTVVEIAEMVGYDFKYFFPLFKKYTGYTPKEYLKYFID